MKFIVIYPGRFHPFHRGHLASYEYLTRKYGEDSVYIATSDVTAPDTSPFHYEDKLKMITRLGIPPGHVKRVKNPYQAQEITGGLSAEEKATTALIFAVSEKDMQAKSELNPKGPRFSYGTKKDGSPTYLQPLPTDMKKIQPMSQHAYVAVTPTVPFRVQGADADSAKQIRNLYINAGPQDRDQIIADLYGEAYPDIREIFDQRLGVNKPQEGIIYGQERIYAGEQEASIMREERLACLRDGIKFLQDKIRQLKDGQDYIDEKWTRKYKKSINCANPRGFSQKAHCAARRKRARGGSTKSKPV